MKKWFVGPLLIGALVLGLILMKPAQEERSMASPKQLRTLTPEQLLTRTHSLGIPLRLRTASDVLPGGYAAAMAPLMIEWKASKPFEKNGFVIIHNLNHGGNPVDGTTVLCSAKVPLDGVKAVEFVFLPLDKVGREGLVQHGQLRFIFEDDKPVELLNYGDQEMGSDSYIWDLVFSWEAWRPPHVGFDVRTGMNPENYMLTPRVFSGPTRFLDDALGQRDWFSYRLRLPNGQLGLAELLQTNLALCDGVGRHTISKILEQSEEEWASQAPANKLNLEAESADWAKLREVLAPKTITSDTLINLSTDDLAYQTLLRSCATMALYTVNVAVKRLSADGFTDGLNPEHQMMPDLGTQEPWMTELAETNLKGIFLRAPAILRYMKDNPQAFPRNIPKILEQAGLLQLENGKVKKIHYQLEKITPYGTLQENLIK